MEFLKKERGTKGFTIIEVMIVLLIVGIIMLIVFLAIPALQRNSRNTQRKNDTAAVTAALTEYSTNNQGRLPTTQAIFDANITDPTNGLAKIGFYTPGDITYSYSASALAADPAPTANSARVFIYNYIKCNGNAVTRTGASARSVAAIYFVETTTSTQQQCLDT
jgi:prepilin-type N-terminal cleavage/methylation domain-containing protein